MSGAIKPMNDDQLDLLSGQTGVANWVTPWRECSQSHQVSFTIGWAAAASTAGTLSFEGTDDPTQAAGLVFAPETNVVPLTITTFHGTYPTVSTSAANALVILENPPKYVRVKYTFSAGGAAGQFRVMSSARAT